MSVLVNAASLVPIPRCLEAFLSIPDKVWVLPLGKGRDVIFRGNTPGCYSVMLFDFKANGVCIETYGDRYCQVA